jgi:hypothetical protein
MFGLMKNAIAKHDGNSFKDLHTFFVTELEENPVGNWVTNLHSFFIGL